MSYIANQSYILNNDNSIRSHPTEQRVETNQYPAFPSVRPQLPAEHIYTPSRRQLANYPTTNQLPPLDVTVGNSRSQDNLNYHYTHSRNNSGGQDSSNSSPTSMPIRRNITSEPNSPTTTFQSRYHLPNGISNGPQTQSSDAMPIVRVLSVDPLLGIGGSQVKVIINIQPSPAAPIRSFRVTFGTVDATTRVAFENRSGAVEHVELVATAPRLAGPVQTGRVSLLVQAVDAHESPLTTADAGAFEYVDAASFGYQGSPSVGPSNPRKRFGDSLVSDRSNPVRPAPLNFSDMYDSPLPSPSLTSPMSAHFGTPQLPTSTLTDKGVFSPNPALHMPSDWKNSSSDPMQEDQEDLNGLGLGSNSLRHPPVPAFQESSSQPTLLRTSQIPAGATKSNGQVPAMSATKAQLRFDGDLNTMAMGWSAEEWGYRRRLVQFWRRQENNIVHAQFRPIRPHEFKINSIVISCIFRDDKNECFVTSVDAIYLLEALVGVRFTVEEKNRIRRNLEGFKPITVSKTKAESEPFFKLIMGFPNPKPRNIEKDVKVFPWRILISALKKIISKYSATTGAPPEIIAAQNLDTSQITDPADSPMDTSSLPSSSEFKTNSHLPSVRLAISQSQQSPTRGSSDTSMTGMPTAAMSPIPSLAFDDPQRDFDFGSMFSQQFGSAPDTLFGMGGEIDPAFADSRPQMIGHHRSFSDLSSLASKGFLPDSPMNTSGHQRSKSHLNLSFSNFDNTPISSDHHPLMAMSIAERRAAPMLPPINRSLSTGILEEPHFSMLE